MTRTDGRNADAPRPVVVELGLQRNPEGSVLYRSGGTSILVAATTAEGIPDWKRGEATGWVTAEYMMHPRCARERQRGRRGVQDGRATEITRLIGRSLRSAIDLGRLGARTLIIDCDVLDADGGTRTASITGAWIALYDCIAWMKARNMLKQDPLKGHVAAVSCGIYNNVPVLDLDYAEDSSAETDANFVMTGTGGIVEIQGTAEKTPFSEAELAELIALAKKGIGRLVELQKLAVT
jgi:ribonuclease PH